MREGGLTEALGEVGLLVDEDLGGDDVAEGAEGLCEVRVRELLRQVVDEQVGPLRALHHQQPIKDPLKLEAGKGGASPPSACRWRAGAGRRGPG